MSRFNRVLGYSPLVLAVALAACASKPPAPKPPPEAVSVQTNIHAGADVNPDFHGRASPIKLRLYELKSPAAFASSDFFSLFEHPQETLSSELVFSEEMTLAPGESRTVQRPFQAGTQVLGVVGAFRDLEHSAWRASTTVDPTEKATYTISLDASGAKIQVDHPPPPPPEKKKCALCIF